MAAEGGRGEAVQSRGMALIDPDQGLDLLGKLLRANTPQTAVMDARWPDMFRLLGNRRPALLADLAAEVKSDTASESKSRVDTAFRTRIIESDEKTRHTLICDYIQSELGRIIGVDPKGLEIDQPVSTFGLDSLLALELKNNLEARLDFTLPMAKLMEGPSIASLAAETATLVVGTLASATPGASSASHKPEAQAKDSPSEPTWTPLLALRPEGTRPPLVLLPPLGGDIRCYADLVQQLDEDVPVYAYRPRGVDDDLPPHQTLAEMMADYAAALRQTLPNGSYCLAGWSTGGIYAVALAEELERSGNEVALLALFDTPPPTICDEIDVDDDANFLCVLVNFANAFSGTSMRVHYDQLMALPPAERFQVALAEARKHGTIPAEAPEEFIRRLVQVGKSNVRVIQGYVPRPVAVPTHLFLPQIPGGLAEVSGRHVAEDGDHGWSHVVGPTLELHSVPGNHFTMMNGEGGRKIAQQLAALIVRRDAVSAAAR
jgi:myxalamid-type polyketide synthase MxaB